MDVPRVDRLALDKLRLLEIHLGADETEEELEAQEPPAETTPQEPRVRYQKPAEEDSDALPLVAEIPNFVKPDPLAPLPLSKLPATALDAEVCPEREGEPCAFVVPAWLGESGLVEASHSH